MGHSKGVFLRASLKRHRKKSSSVNEGEDAVEAGSGDEAEAGGAAKALLNPGPMLPLAEPYAGWHTEHSGVVTYRRLLESWITRPPGSACIGCGKIRRSQPESGIVRPTGSDTRPHGRSGSPPPESGIVRPTGSDTRLHGTSSRPRQQQAGSPRHESAKGRVRFAVSIQTTDGLMKKCVTAEGTVAAPGAALSFLEPGRRRRG